MKKGLLTLALLFISIFAGYSQIVLSSIDLNPDVNNTFVNISCDTTGIAPMVAGPNRVWDFTAGRGLTPLSVDTFTYIYPYYAPFHDNYPGATLAAKSWRKKNDTMYRFYTASYTRFSYNGHYRRVNDNFAYTDASDLLQFPLHYGDTYSDEYSASVHYNYLGSPTGGTLDGYTNTTCDGWGKLILPTGTYDSVLRVHTQEMLNDHFAIYGLPFYVKVNVNTYRWYARTFHNPLLEITISDDTSGVFHWRSVKYSTAFIRTGVNEIAGDATFNIYPNPANATLTVALPGANQPISAIDVVDMAGAVVTSLPYNGESAVHINVGAWPAGNYLIRVHNGSQVTTRLFTKQ
ncbi:MAG: T9SS C-terminal target domain-containing protein [Chitinophagia bacterium]|nr:T9SS C-terminal target domain-containing protein [Chitinophagia bacterium]